jgi:hypothetical protein
MPVIHLSYCLVVIILAEKRSVTNLSAAQLVRKRANDREAQKQSRQKQKHNVSSLEGRIALLEERELDLGKHICQLQEAMSFNRFARVQVEEENKLLRAQLGQVPQQTMGGTREKAGTFVKTLTEQQQQQPYDHDVVPFAHQEYEQDATGSRYTTSAYGIFYAFNDQGTSAVTLTWD